MPKLYTQQIGDNTDTDQGQTRTNPTASHGRSDHLITCRTLWPTEQL